MIPEEFADIPRQYFSEVKVEKTLAYPDGSPGFYFVRLTYADNIEEMMAAQAEAHHQLDFRDVTVGGEAARLGHSKIDLGKIEYLFDANTNTLIRSWALNPLLLDFTFPAPRPFDQVSLRIGGTATTIRLMLWSEDGQVPIEINRQEEETVLPRNIALDLPAGKRYTRVLVTVFNTFDPDDGHVHLWEINFK
jgi:hypothetical protein